MNKKNLSPWFVSVKVGVCSPMVLSPWLVSIDVGVSGAMIRVPTNHEIREAGNRKYSSVLRILSGLKEGNPPVVISVPRRGKESNR